MALDWKCVWLLEELRIGAIAESVHVMDLLTDTELSSILLYSILIISLVTKESTISKCLIAKSLLTFPKLGAGKPSLIRTRINCKATYLSLLSFKSLITSSLLWLFWDSKIILETSSNASVFNP